MSTSFYVVFQIIFDKNLKKFCDRKIQNSIKSPFKNIRNEIGLNYPRSRSHRVELKQLCRAEYFVIRHKVKSTVIRNGQLCYMNRQPESTPMKKAVGRYYFTHNYNSCFCTIAMCIQGTMRNTNYFDQLSEEKKNILGTFLYSFDTISKRKEDPDSTMWCVKHCYTCHYVLLGIVGSIIDP